MKKEQIDKKLDLLEEYATLLDRRRKILLKRTESKEDLESYMTYLLRLIEKEKKLLKKVGGKLTEKEEELLKELNNKEELIRVFGKNLTFR